MTTETHAQGTAPTWPTLMDADTLGQYLQVSGDTVRRMRTGGRLPEPITLAVDRSGRPRTVRWRRDVIDQWVTAGCPTVDEMPTPGSAGARGAQKRGGRRAPR
jgi:predicted DNA-binding transcriptional regulator AlpA